MTIERAVTPVIKAADVVMGPPVMVGGGIPILQQAEAVASAAWSKFEVPKAFQSALADVNLDPARAPSGAGSAQQFFENNMNIVSIISRFNSQPELNAADAISEAESILAQAARPQIIIPQPLPKPEVDVIFWPEPVTRTDQTTQVVEIAPQQQEVEKGVEEQVKIEQPKMSLEEEVVEDERLYLEDEQASLQRRYEIKEATKKAKVEVIRRGLKKITGWLVAHFLPAEHVGNRSQVVKKKGPDGSYQETVEAISLSGEFDSEQQAQERFDEIVTEKPPVRKGQNGRIVDQESIARVYKYHLLKPSAIVEIIRTRIIKKTVQVPGQNLPQTTVTEIPEIGSEHCLDDNPKLAAVLNPSVLTDLNSLS